LQSVSITSGAQQQQNNVLSVTQSTKETQTGSDGSGTGPGYAPAIFFHQRSRMPVTAQMVRAPIRPWGAPVTTMKSIQDRRKVHPREKLPRMT
jgi:hypothetical protein